MVLHSPIFANLSNDVFYKRALTSPYCPDGKKKITKLKPDLICNDEFYVGYDETINATKIIMNKTGKEYLPYSLYVNSDGSYWADICTAGFDSGKER